MTALSMWYLPYLTLPYLTYIRPCIHTNIGTDRQACMHVYIRTYVHTCMRAYVQTDRQTFVHACMRACMHTYIRTCRQTDRQACMHAHTHTQDDNDIRSGQNSLLRKSIGSKWVLIARGQSDSHFLNIMRKRVVICSIKTGYIFIHYSYQNIFAPIRTFLLLSEHFCSYQNIFASNILFLHLCIY